MAGIKALAKETAIYGLSSIIGRFLNWCLVPLYVYLFPTEEYGIVSYLYSFTAVVLVILNYGMETGFFRFANKETDPDKVYTTTLASTAVTSALFILIITLWLRPISAAILLPRHPFYVALLATTVAIDAFSNIPFAYLRYQKKALRFAGIKLLNVFINIGLNLFFLLVCPYLDTHAPALISWFYSPLGGKALGIGWIFIANIVSSAVVFLCLLPQVSAEKWRFDFRLWRRMLGYSWPLLILGVAGILSQNMGQMAIPYIFKGAAEVARSMVGIYGANIKIAIVMVMFTQAFRYAYEPFIFAKARETNSPDVQKQAYCDAMKFFVVFGLFIFLAVMFFMPILKHFISPRYWEGLRVVPIMMAAELCFGIFFNLSLWYKLTDRTYWGMWLSLICFALMLGFNLWWVPLIGIPDGYLGSAWAALASYAAVMIVSYFLGRHYYPLPYQVGRMSLYLIGAGALWLLGEAWQPEGKMTDLLVYTWRCFLLMAYLSAICRFENIPVISAFSRKSGKSNRV